MTISFIFHDFTADFHEKIDQIKAAKSAKLFVPGWRMSRIFKDILSGYLNINLARICVAYEGKTAVGCFIQVDDYSSDIFVRKAFRRKNIAKTMLEISKYKEQKKKTEIFATGAECSHKFFKKMIEQKIINNDQYYPIW